MVTDSTKSISISALVWLTIAAVIVVVGLWFVIQKIQTRELLSDSRQEFADATEELLVGDLNKALAEIPDEFKNMQNVSREAIDLQFAYASALFISEDEKDRAEAAAMMREFADNDRIGERAQAIAANTLVWAAYTDLGYFTSPVFPFYLNPSTVAEVPQYEALLRQSQDITDPDYISARHTLMYYIMRHSYTLNPTPFSALFLANWQSHLLLKTPYRDNVERDTPEAIQAAAEEYLSKVNALLQVEEGMEYTLLESDLISYLYWKGVVLGDLLVAGYPLEEPFEESFEDALSRIQSAQRITNNIYPNYADFIHFYSAVYLLNEETVRTGQVQYHLTLLNSSLASNTDAKPGSFRSFLDVTLQEKKDGRQTPRYDYVLTVADTSPEFASYLRANGWEF